jgi:hypothetical protein
MRLAGQEPGDETMEAINGNTLRAAYENLKAAIARHSTDKLYAVVRHVGNDISESHICTLRGLCLTEIENRCGLEATDALMAEVGL